MAAANTKQAAIPNQPSLTGLRLGSETILVLFARAGAAAGRAATRAGATAAATATATGTSTAA